MIQFWQLQHQLLACKPLFRGRLILWILRWSEILKLSSKKHLAGALISMYDWFSSWFISSTKVYTEILVWQVLSVAMINAGYAHDIIPDSATFGGTFRAFSKKSFYGLRKRIEEVNVWFWDETTFTWYYVGWRKLHLVFPITCIRNVPYSRYYEAKTKDRKRFV